jgi:hypothetical protein
MICSRFKKTTCLFESLSTSGLASTSAAEVEVSLSCTKSNGAVLSLPFDAHREDTSQKKRFSNYIAKHCESWFGFTSSNGLDVDRMEDIVLVTGCDCTQPWLLAAFTESNTSVDIPVDFSLLGGVVSAPALKWKFAQKQGKSIPYNYSQLSYARTFDLIRD